MVKGIPLIFNQLSFNIIFLILTFVNQNSANLEPPSYLYISPISSVSVMSRTIHSTRYFAMLMACHTHLGPNQNVLPTPPYSKDF